MEPIRRVRGAFPRGLTGPGRSERVVDAERFFDFLEEHFWIDRLYDAACHAVTQVGEHSLFRQVFAGREDRNSGLCFLDPLQKFRAR